MTMPDHFGTTMKPIDFCLLVLMLFFLMFPIYLPRAIIPYVENPIFLVLLFLAVIYTFLYYNPILGVVSVFFVYELLRRNIKSSALGLLGEHDTTPSSSKSRVGNGGGGGGGGGGGKSRSERINELVPSSFLARTLEEDVISNMAPINVSPVVANESAVFFEPVLDDTHNAFRL